MEWSENNKNMQINISLIKFWGVSGRNSGKLKKLHFSGDIEFLYVLEGGGCIFSCAREGLVIFFRCQLNFHDAPTTIKQPLPYKVLQKQWSFTNEYILKF